MCFSIFILYPFFHLTHSFMNFLFESANIFEIFMPMILLYQFHIFLGRWMHNSLLIQAFNLQRGVSYWLFSPLFSSYLLCSAHYCEIVCSVTFIVLFFFSPDIWRLLCSPMFFISVSETWCFIYLLYVFRF